MKKEFWIQKWQSQQIGFHKDFVHPLLKKYLSKFNLNKADTIFVPLCGKSLDMIWLHQQGYNVIGVEISEIAILNFITENRLSYTKSISDGLVKYEMDGISIYHADIFKLTSEHLKNVSAIYDRASLIALPDEIITNYVSHLKTICNKNIPWLLIVLEYDKQTGPPFSQDHKKITGLFNEFASLKMLREKDIIAKEPKFQSEGCQYLIERVYLIVT